MKIKPPRKTPNSARFLNAYGPYEHGIWSKQENSLDSTSEFAGTMLFYRRSYELVEQISKSLLEIFTKNELKAGHLITLEDLVALRPGKGGMSPKLASDLVGKKLLCDLPAQHQLQSVDLK